MTRSVSLCGDRKVHCVPSYGSRVAHPTTGPRPPQRDAPAFTVKPLLLSLSGRGRVCLCRHTRQRHGVHHQRDTGSACGPENRPRFLTLEVLLHLTRTRLRRHARCYEHFLSDFWNHKASIKKYIGLPFWKMLNKHAAPKYFTEPLSQALRGPVGPLRDP